MPKYSFQAFLSPITTLFPRLLVLRRFLGFAGHAEGVSVNLNAAAPAAKSLMI